MQRFDRAGHSPAVSEEYESLAARIQRGGPCSDTCGSYLECLADRRCRSSLNGRKMLCALRTLQEHFAAEEDAIRNNGYCWDADHAVEHSLLCAKIENFLQQYPTDDDIVAFVGRFMDIVLAAHDRSHDQRFELWARRVQQARLPHGL